MYVFVRKDLSDSQIAVQASHACIESTRRFSQDRHPRLVLIGIKNERKLKSILAELRAKNVKVTEFIEEDNSITALATEPIKDDRRHLFQRFSLL